MKISKLRINLTPTYSANIKRFFDVILAAISLIIFSPLLYITIFFIKIDSFGPIFFKQMRIGQHLKPFQLIKFRSMSILKDINQQEFDPGDIQRVTKVGKFLRKTKLDELPELFNVLNGDMSVVGPRPEVEKYVKVFLDDFNEILKNKPGLTDYASIKYRDEETILAKQSEPERYYRQIILPDKLYLAKRYIEDISFKTDMRIIKETLKCIVKTKQ